MRQIHGFCFSVSDKPITAADYAPFLEKIRPQLRWGIRSYSTFGHLDLGRTAHSLGLKLAAGAWFDTDLARNAREVESIISLSKAGDVDIAVLGNETLFRQDLKAAQLIDYIRQFKKAVPNVPVATGDVGKFLLANPEVIDELDIVGMHHYPFWCGTHIDQAAKSMKDLYEEVYELTSRKGKPLWIFETGWPSDGKPLKEAEPTPANAERYFREILSWTEANEIPIFYFEAFDEPWKVRDEGPHGEFWGVHTKTGERKYWY